MTDKILGAFAVVVITFGCWYLGAAFVALVTWETIIWAPPNWSPVAKVLAILWFLFICNCEKNVQRKKAARRNATEES